MTQRVTHYEVLGVGPEASPAEVRKAYVSLARTHHPDFHATASVRTREEAERRMQLINEAWLVLGDANARAAYDRALATSDTPPPERDGWRPGSGTAHPDFVPVDADDDEPFPGEDEDRGGTGRRVPAWQQLLPVALLAGSLGAFAGGLVLTARPLLVLAAVLLVLSLAGFVLTPMLAVLRTYERDPDR